jgi:hypothetical protein
MPTKADLKKNYMATFKPGGGELYRDALMLTFGTYFKDQVLEQVEKVYMEFPRRLPTSDNISGAVVRNVAGFTHEVEHGKVLTVSCRSFEYYSDFTINNVLSEEIESIELIAPGEFRVEYPNETRQMFSNQQFTQMPYGSRLQITTKKVIDGLSVSMTGLVVDPELYDLLYKQPYSTDLIFGKK